MPETPAAKLRYRYRCPACDGLVEADPADDMPVCNATDQCGFLFEPDLIPTPPAPYRKGLKFQLADIPDGGYRPDDERTYTVHYRGVTIGTVERDWIPAATPGATPLAGWAFEGNGLKGSGLTRAGAVLDAWSWVTD